MGRWVQGWHPPGEARAWQGRRAEAAEAILVREQYEAQLKAAQQAASAEHAETKVPVWCFVWPWRLLVV